MEPTGRDTHLVRAPAGRRDPYAVIASTGGGSSL